MQPYIITSEQHSVHNIDMMIESLHYSDLNVTSYLTTLGAALISAYCIVTRFDHRAWVFEPFANTALCLLSNKTQIGLDPDLAGWRRLGRRGGWEGTGCEETSPEEREKEWPLTSCSSCCSRLSQVHWDTISDYGSGSTVLCNLHTVPSQTLQHVERGLKEVPWIRHY